MNLEHKALLVIVSTSPASPGDMSLAQLAEWKGLRLRIVERVEMLHELDERVDAVAVNAASTQAELAWELIKSWSREAHVYFFNLGQASIEDEKGFWSRILEFIPREVSAKQAYRVDGKFIGSVAEDITLTGPEQSEFRIQERYESLSIVWSPRGSCYSYFQDGCMSLFVCSVHETLDIYAPLQNELEDNWMSLLPALVFLQSAYGEACWHVKLRNACLIIDDPTLEKSYGFVEYRELADRAHADDFSVNIAFIPYNRKRNHQEVVDRFHAEPERFSVSIHGCYHTEREFGTANIAEARFLSYTAQQLMRDHGEMTGLRANNVMVFPQEVWSECALYSLKEAGYLAACASRVYPQEKFEKSQAANLIDLADIHRHQFPLFVRKYFSDVSLELLTILHLVGRPIVLVCHHDDFRNGYSRLSQIVRDIRMISPSIVWSSLESVARNAVRYHRTGAGDFRAQIFSRSAYVRNELSRAVSYKIFKKENELDRVLAVRVDGRVVDHQLSEECGVSISQVLEPNSIIEIEVEYQFNQEYLFRRGLKRKMLTHLRRVLCYYRDTLIAPAKKKMGLK